MPSEIAVRRRSSEILRRGVGFLRAGKSFAGYYFFALGAVAVTVGCDHQEPLIEVEVAEDGMLEEVSAQIGLRAGGEFAGALAGRFEFGQELLVGHAAGRQQNIRRRQTLRAADCAGDQCGVLALENAAPEGSGPFSRVV